MAHELIRRFPARPDDPTGVGAVLRTGRPEFVPALTPELIEELVPPGGRREAIDALGIVAAMTVPLTARGRILGALTLVSAESGRRFTTDDLAFAEDLGARAGLAIDNAMLLDRSREIARTLQDSLLPASLPDVEGLDVAARYVAGGEGVEVGGDFYDLFPVDGGRGWAAVLGDVCGKGTEAAALTALARHTLRAESDEVSPAEVLGRLNRAILREGTDSRFLTATYAWLRHENGAVDVRLARGGHPPSLLVRADGSVETLCPAGPLLGIMDDIRFAESGFALRARRHARAVQRRRDRGALTRRRAVRDGPPHGRRGRGVAGQRRGRRGGAGVGDRPLRRGRCQRRPCAARDPRHGRNAWCGLTRMWIGDY